ncbi:MAG: SDR family oxidoreductase [Alphaproteobacteria bacterium]|nr:SDR family oxidoreductase [Alphaproteobacteria bacterium]
MKNKTVLITGAARGIGRQAALEFARLGANVIIDDLPDAESTGLLNELKSILESEYKVRAIAVSADIGVEVQAKDLAAAAINEFGKIDVLVNNAGIAIDKDFGDRTLADWTETFATNLFGMFRLSQIVGEHMVENGGGNIINISSTNGIDAVSPFSIDYDASKAGAINITKTLAVQFAPHVRVNAVAPGWVDTDFNKDLSADYLAGEMEKVCLKRIAVPDEIAKIIRFLAGDDASYINGAVIVADGGRL